jgi:hypothetical protein
MVFSNVSLVRGRAPLIAEEIGLDRELNHCGKGAAEPDKTSYRFVRWPRGGIARDLHDTCNARQRGYTRIHGRVDVERDIRKTVAEMYL